MKTILVRALVVAFVLGVFGFLALSPTTAQSTANSKTQDGPMGCCGNKSSEISCPSGFHAEASDGAATCVKDNTSSTTSH